MRNSCIIVALICLAAMGCQPQQTNIVRTARLPDGTELSYSNTSSGYFFNPNYTSDPGLGGPGPLVVPIAAGVLPGAAVYPMPYAAPGCPPYGPGCLGPAVVLPDYGGWGR